MGITCFNEIHHKTALGAKVDFFQNKYQDRLGAILWNADCVLGVELTVRHLTFQVSWVKYGNYIFLEILHNTAF
jgi:hypothetical protein